MKRLAVKNVEPNFLPDSGFGTRAASEASQHTSRPKHADALVRSVELQSMRALAGCWPTANVYNFELSRS